MSLQNDDNNPDLSKEVEASLKKLHIKDVDILKPQTSVRLQYLQKWVMILAQLFPHMAEVNANP